MALNTLKDIRDAAVNAVKNSVIPGLTVSPIPPNSTDINPNEDFQLSLSAANSSGIQVKNVRYKISITSDQAKANLFAPPSTLAEAREVDTNAIIPPGAQRDAMILSHVTDRILEPGDTDHLTIRGRALGVGAPRISFEVIVDIDQAHLFPVNQSSNRTSKTVLIKD